MSLSRNTPMQRALKKSKCKPDAGPERSHQSAENDPFDLGNMRLSISETQARLRDHLRQIAPNRQLQQTNIESVQVNVKGASGTVRLSDIAQVVPKGGRTITLLVAQQESVNPIISAVLQEFQVNPIASTNNPLELHITIPPPTQESRKQARQQVVVAGENALKAVRQARATQQKLNRAMELSRKHRPDDLRKAGKIMDEIVDKGNDEVRKAIEIAKKAMETYVTRLLPIAINRG